MIIALVAGISGIVYGLDLLSKGGDVWWVGIIIVAVLLLVLIKLVKFLFINKPSNNEPK